MENSLSSSDEEMNMEEIECGGVELCCYSNDNDDVEEVGGSFSSCHSQFNSTYNSCGGGMSRRVSFSDSCSVNVDDDDDLHIISHLDKVVVVDDNPPPVAIEERDCRICHMSLVIADDDAIELGCCCKDDLANAHKHCALTWFQIKGNKTCEICNSIVTNLVIPNEMTTNHATIDMNPAATSVATSHMSTASGGGRGCINGHRLLNFILACLVFAFVISWLFHFNIPS